MRNNGWMPEQKGNASSRAHAALSLKTAGTIIGEALWSRRCVICDRPGPALCRECRDDLAYIDAWQACPRCGAPFGRIVCTECNRFSLRQRNRRRLPYDRCASAVTDTEESRRIVTAYKDGGERSLAETIADIAADRLPPVPIGDGRVVSFVPASAPAIKRRGFDHAEEVARLLAKRMGLPAIGLFERPDGLDQRGLSRSERVENMDARLRIRREWVGRIPAKILIYDDVCTTGATLFAASDALREAGCRSIECATFSRVW